MSWKSATPPATWAARCGSGPIQPRCDVNTNYKDRLEQHGLRFSGMSPDGVLPEIVEYEDHPWFIGVQFHPELKSRPFEPHPLFASFIQAAVVQSRLV